MRLLIVLLLLTISFHAQADTTKVYASFICGTSEESAKLFYGKYEEAPIIQGVTMEGNLFTVWRSANGETWSALLHLTDGRVCLMEAGTDLGGLIWFIPPIEEST